jgi:hypothetical protein
MLAKLDQLWGGAVVLYCPLQDYVVIDYALILLPDVGLVLRQLLTRAEDLFGGLFNLTLCDKLVRGQVPERAVRAVLIVVEPPGFYDVLGLGHRGELVYVQTFISQSAVKGFNKGILVRLAWLNIPERDPAVGAPARKRNVSTTLRHLLETCVVHSNTSFPSLSLA